MVSMLGRCRTTIPSSILSRIGNAAIAGHATTTRMSYSSRPAASPLVTDEEYAMAGLRKELMPKHVAIMLDGSRRWSKAHGKPLSYSPVLEANVHFAEFCLKWGVSIASSGMLFLNNFKRGKESMDFVFDGLERHLELNMDNFMRKNIRVSIIGDKTLLPKSLQNTMKQVEEATNNLETKAPHVEFKLAIAYAGTRDIVLATRKLCEKAKAGLIEPDAIDEALFDQELLTCGTPPPDFCIRTGGHLRLSDYLTWQFANTELYFTDIYGPEFTEVEFLKAMRCFQQRVRNFGN